MTLLSDRWDLIKNQRAHIAVLQCNMCHMIFEKRFSSCNHASEHHFCSKRCVQDAWKNDGPTITKQKNTNLERYGVEAVGSLADLHRKSVNTSKNRYGNALELIQEKKLQTELKNMVVIHY